MVYMTSIVPRPSLRVLAIIASDVAHGFKGHHFLIACALRESLGMRLQRKNIESLLYYPASQNKSGRPHSPVNTSHSEISRGMHQQKA